MTGYAGPLEEIFVACTGAVNTALGRGSVRHGGSPCPERAARDPDGRTVLAFCERGCFDDAVDLLDDVLARVRRQVGDRPADGGPGPVDIRAYAARTATTALGELHRDRRKQLGLPQRPERVPDAGWAIRILPDQADRKLLAHMLTWLGSDAPAADAGTGWPTEVWAHRYQVSTTAMAGWIDRVSGALRAADARRYVRYLAGPLAAKPVPPALFADPDILLDQPVFAGSQRSGTANAPGYYETTR